MEDGLDQVDLTRPRLTRSGLVTTIKATDKLLRVDDAAQKLGRAEEELASTQEKSMVPPGKT